ncbi:MAG TPA: hypothetical protein VN643_22110 [Pyrinomonadaceae bacterium]|nr:hypothetical protein [Pyrinomonadaceae bacterium]
MLSLKRNSIVPLALLASILLSPINLFAQDLRNSSTGDWSRLNSLDLGSKLSIRTKIGEAIDGKLISVSDTSLSLTVKTKTVNLNRDDIFSVYHVTKKSAAKATLIGLGVGAGGGLALGLAGRGDDGFVKLERAFTAGFTVIGAGAGAATGWLIGRGGKKKVLVYQAP